MSDHYDLFFTFDLKQDLPVTVTKALDYVLGKETELDNLLHDEKFSVETWKNLLVLPRNEMHYFPGHTVSILSTRVSRNLSESDGGGKEYRKTITFRFDMHDDTLFGVFLLFLDWIAPYIETEGYIGYYVSSGNHFYPTLILCHNGQLELMKCNPAKIKTDG